MRAFAALLATTLLLTGCTLDLRGTEWKKSGAMFQEVSLVEVECAVAAVGCIQQLHDERRVPALELTPQIGNVRRLYPMKAS
jgi:hypothetical protein